jgi:predicted sugar kinase
VHLKHNTVWTSIHSTIVQLKPVDLQIPLASRMNNELGYISLRTLEPLADNFSRAILRQHVCVVVFGNGGFVVPGGAAIDKLGLDA